jgi:hypothetical protein
VTHSVVRRANKYEEARYEKELTERDINKCNERKRDIYILRKGEKRARINRVGRKRERELQI